LGCLKLTYNQSVDLITNNANSELTTKRSKKILCSGYLFGFNGQEKDDEITGSTGSHYTATFWEYDSRIGRRWNIDPKPVTGISDYACFGNNPIWYSDPLGDTIRGKTGSDTQKMLGQMKNIFGANNEIFNKYFTVGSDNKTFNKVESRLDFNKWLYGKGEYKDQGSGFSNEQIAMANGFMKIINAGYSIDVEFGEGISTFSSNNKLTGTAFIGSNNLTFMDDQGNLRTSTITQRFVHEVLGEGFTAGNTGDMGTIENIQGKYNNTADWLKDPFLRKANLQIIQAENIYNQTQGYLRSGIHGQAGGHYLLQSDKPNVGNIPANFRSSFFVEGDWVWPAK
jgi:RHS repeat-associated protein